MLSKPAQIKLPPEVVLRPWKKNDAHPLAVMANNKKIWDNLRDHIPYPYTLTDAEKWVAHCNTQKPMLNFAIIYNSEIAGSIGCLNKTDVYRKNMEIGYFIGEQFWNLGIATEAVRILVDYITKKFDVLRLHAEAYGKQWQAPLLNFVEHEQICFVFNWMHASQIRMRLAAVSQGVDIRIAAGEQNAVEIIHD